MMARTIYNIALLLQLVVKVHYYVAQYVTRSSTIWTASRSMLPICMVRHVAHLFVAHVAAPWRTRTVCMLIFIIITRVGHQLLEVFRTAYSFTLTNRNKLQVDIDYIE